MKKILIVLCLLFFKNAVYGQISEGIVQFTRHSSWVKIQEQMPYLSKEEKDRAKLTWGDDGWKEKYLLKFNQNSSLYEADPNSIDNEGWSGRAPILHFFHDYSQGTKIEVEEMLGKTYILEDSIASPKWRVQNKIKEVAGHICMLAVSEDTIKKQKIEAWFAQDLPISGGPERYTGLPGLILEINVNDGCLVITADKIIAQNVSADLKAPKKKGKKIKNADYDLIISKHIKDSMKSYRNPFWAIRY